jgi:phage N-6-adenine-methyltransferase
MNQGTTALVRYDAACRALAEAKAVDEVREIRGTAEAIRAYAHQAKNRTLEIDAAEIRFRAERRLGELIDAQRQTVGLSKGGRPDKTGSELDPVITLSEAGIDKHLADRARKFAALPMAEFEGQIDAWRARVEQDTERITLAFCDRTRPHVAQNTGDPEWFTPADYAAAARAVLGAIDLDPASTPEANAVIQAERFYTAADDGLTQPWCGRVWLNPPYANVEPFANKLAASVTAHDVTTAIVLVNNASETVWFRTISDIASAMCLPTRRIRFWHLARESAQPLQGQAVLYIGLDGVRFRERFAPFGKVWWPDRQEPERLGDAGDAVDA